ncbi:hypothetical protein [uncultured Caulobacter sp.]|mgnify:CR=1 FL=1|uniref:hypothetical protein n=1 Tax=uncultured Caulobacter sp. TaxID=158749 RepID=UPI002606D56B|nr:hypothetical protein [uncultured Caulobacter sp.]
MSARERLQGDLAALKANGGNLSHFGTPLTRRPRWNKDIARDLQEILDENERLRTLIDSPETDDFVRGVQLEAAHQVKRWGAEHDAGKKPHDWFWLLGYLGGKALAAAISGDLAKAKHHTISTAAALANWHAQLSGSPTAMRPGVDAEARGFTAISGDTL